MQRWATRRGTGWLKSEIKQSSTLTASSITMRTRAKAPRSRAGFRYTSGDIGPRPCMRSANRLSPHFSGCHKSCGASADSFAYEANHRLSFVVAALSEPALPATILGASGRLTGLSDNSARNDKPVSVPERSNAARGPAPASGSCLPRHVRRPPGQGIYLSGTARVADSVAWTQPALGGRGRLPDPALGRRTAARCHPRGAGARD